VLRTVLITFGWAIPIVTIFLTAAQIYLAFDLNARGIDRGQDLWILLVRHISYGVQSLALSPLCFFGAFMLNKRLEFGE